MPIRFGVALGVSLAVALMAAWADWSLAGSARSAASGLAKEFARPSRLLAFEGHWGFQYMEQLGAKALDESKQALVSGEVVIVPLGNSYLFGLPPARVAGSRAFRVPVGKGLTVQSKSEGAGFYSDGWGPIPFALQRAPVEDYLALDIK